MVAFCAQNKCMMPNPSGLGFCVGCSLPGTSPVLYFEENSEVEHHQTKKQTPNHSSLGELTGCFMRFSFPETASHWVPPSHSRHSLLSQDPHLCLVSSAALWNFLLQRKQMYLPRQQAFWSNSWSWSCKWTADMLFFSWMHPMVHPKGCFLEVKQ